MRRISKRPPNLHWPHCCTHGLTLPICLYQFGSSSPGAPSHGIPHLVHLLVAKVVVLLRLDIQDEASGARQHRTPDPDATRPVVPTHRLPVVHVHQPQAIQMARFSSLMRQHDGPQSVGGRQGGQATPHRLGQGRCGTECIGASWGDVAATFCFQASAAALFTSETLSLSRVAPLTISCPTWLAL